MVKMYIYLEKKSDPNSQILSNITLPIPSEISRENARTKVVCGIFFLKIK